MSEAPPPYAAVLVVEVDDESERPPSHRLCGDEGVLEGDLAAGEDGGAELERREVLDVELIILKGSEGTRNHQTSGAKALLQLRGLWEILYLRVPEGGVQRFHKEVLWSLVGEAQQELDDVVGWEIWMDT